jgi:hypothetical protein
MREELAKVTPEERIAAAQRYMQARYAKAEPDVIRGIERVTGETYDQETGEWRSDS